MTLGGSLSNIRREELRGRKPRKKINEEYPFCKRLNRLVSIEEEIRALFDNPDEVELKAKGRLKNYDGKIAGIEARIEVGKTGSPHLYAKTEKDGGKAYDKVLKILIGR